jgi:AraC-like DNA-binding protein
MPASNLAEHDGTVFDSTDPQRTEAFCRSAYGNTSKFSGDPAHFRFRASLHALGPTKFSTIEQTVTIESRADPLPLHLGVVRIHQGVRIDHTNGERLGPGDICLNSKPGQHMYIRNDSTRYGAALIPTQALAEAARNRPDDELGPLRFESVRPADPVAARRWLHTVHFVTGSLRSEPEAMAQPLLSGAAIRLLAAALLTAFPNTWTTEPHHQDRIDATPTSLTRAMAFIEANADIDISLVDIARAAYVTVRAVQLAFRRGLDTTPLAYLRRVRLDRAHEQLQAANPGDGTTITEIAARWGFADPSRFAALYRNTFGELPSQTLRN